MEAPYKILINCNFERVKRYFEGWTPGDPLWQSFEGVIIASSDDPLDLAEHLFIIHNRDDRPDGQVGPSLSVGDVVIIGELAFAVRSVGFELVTGPFELVTAPHFGQL